MQSILNDGRAGARSVLIISLLILIAETASPVSLEMTTKQAQCNGNMW